MVVALGFAGIYEPHILVAKPNSHKGINPILSMSQTHASFELQLAPSAIAME
jgi:hypothetical protein